MLYGGLNMLLALEYTNSLSAVALTAVAFVVVSVVVVQPLEARVSL
jgi:hypothetical protein